MQDDTTNIDAPILINYTSNFILTNIIRHSRKALIEWCKRLVGEMEW